MDRPNGWGIGGLVLVVVAALFAVWMSQPPTAVPASAPETVFSAERAHVHMRAMAQRPHPAGSAENDRVCQYIQDELAKMGIHYELAERYVKSGSGLTYQRAVLGRIPGTDSTKAFAVDAHFDSVPYGPGATDDISGVSAMLEAARALKASPPLKNDVILVFTDQEECASSGARLFRDHPWFRDVGVMLGLETRGTSGPALMFETSQENGFVIREMAKAGVSPRASSTMFDIYDRLPFGSDFGAYKRHVAGLNVAYIDDFAHYHTVLDNPEKANMDSLQHHGEYTLGLARHFGSMPLDETYAPNVTYFNTLGSHMVVYDYKWNLPVAIAVTALAMASLFLGFAFRRIRITGLLMALLVQVAGILMTAAVVGGLSYLIFQRFREMALYSDHYYAFAYVAFTLAVLVLLMHWTRNRIRGAEFVAALLIIYLPSLYAFLYYMPGGAHQPSIVLLFGALYLIGLILIPENAPRAVALAALLVLPALMFIAPNLMMFRYTLTSMASFLLCGLVLILASALAPQIHLLTNRARYRLAGALTVLALVVFGLGYVNNLPSPDSPRLNCLSYGVDWNANKAYWLSTDHELDEWTQQFFPGEDADRGSCETFLPGDTTAYRKAEAPMPPFGPPTFDVQSDTIVDGKRVLEMHYTPSRDNYQTSIHALDDVKIERVEVNGQVLVDSPKNWYGNFKLVPRDGFPMRLVMAPDTPLKFHVREETYGVPAFEQYEPRPTHMATQTNRRLFRHDFESEHTWTVSTADLGTHASAR